MKKSETEKATEMEKSETENSTVEKTERQGSGSVNFEQLRDDLFREVTTLVSEDPSSKIAILINRPGSSSESDASMLSFGYPSADDVVKTFLKDTKSPDTVPMDADDDEENDDEEEDQSSEMFWWNDPKVLDSEDPEELQAAVDSIEKTLEILKDLKNDNGEPKP